MSSFEAHFHLKGGSKPLVETFDEDWTAEEVSANVSDALDDTFVLIQGRDNVSEIFLAVDVIERVYIIEVVG